MNPEMQDQINRAIAYETMLGEANARYAKGGEEGEEALKEITSETWTQIEGLQRWLAKNYRKNREIARLCSSYPFVGELLIYLRLAPKTRIQWGEAAAAAARLIKDRHAEAAHQHKLAMAYIDLGQFKKAIPHLKRGAALNRMIKRPAYEGSDFGGLGLAYAGLNDPRKAIRYYEKAIAIYRATPNNEDARWGEGIYLSNLAESWRALGDPRKAIALHEEALKINREVKDVNSEAYAHGNLGKAYADVGEHERALECFQKQLAMAGENEVPQSEGYAYFELGRLLWKMGKRKQAIENAENALEKFETTQDFYTSRTKQLLKKWRKEERVELAPAKAKRKNKQVTSN
jgi:tetratricopeptide (TPR) repeat protein